MKTRLLFVLLMISGFTAFTQEVPIIHKDGKGEWKEYQSPVDFSNKKIDSTANSVIVATTSSQQIDGALTKTFTTQYTGIQVQNDGSNWYILAWIDGRNGTAGTF